MSDEEVKSQFEKGDRVMIREGQGAKYRWKEAKYEFLVEAPAEPAGWHSVMMVDGSGRKVVHRDNIRKGSLGEFKVPGTLDGWERWALDMLRSHKLCEPAALEEPFDADVFQERIDVVLRTLDLLVHNPTPIPMRLRCEKCGKLHIDMGVFATKPHKSHRCAGCGNVWQPAGVPTVGVKFLPGMAPTEEELAE